MELGFPLELIYLTKFTKILWLSLFLKEKAMGRKKSQAPPDVSNFAVLENKRKENLWYHQPRGLVNTLTNGCIWEPVSRGHRTCPFGFGDLSENSHAHSYTDG